jgi:hypothetical protein
VERGEVIALRMPLGKYRGMEVKDVPPSYLTWLLRRSGIVLSPPLRQEVEDSLTLDRLNCLGPTWWYEQRKGGVAS